MIAPLPSAAQAAHVGNWAGFRAGFVTTVTFGSHPDEHQGLPVGPSSNGDYILKHRTSGWQAGATGGYFWQQGPMVEGLELDIQYGNNGGTQSLGGVAHRDGSGASPANFLSVREHTDTMVDLRGIIGFTASRHLMPYVTGGWFYEHGHYDGQFHAPPQNDFILRDGAARGGWTIGGGVAYQFHQIWVLKAEYLYYNVGHLVAATVPANGQQSQFDFAGTGALARLALTVRVP